MSYQPFPVIRYEPRGSTHYAMAGSGSGPADGSLHGMYTLCGKAIDIELDYNAWTETPNEPVSCKVCQRSERAGRDHRNARNLLAACEALLADAEQRPGAYLHVDLIPIFSAVSQARDVS